MPANRCDISNALLHERLLTASARAKWTELLRVCRAVWWASARDRWGAGVGVACRRNADL